MNNFAGVYEIISTVTGHRYVGSTVNIRKRWIIHRCLLKHGNHSRKLQAVFDNHEKLEFHVLMACEEFEIVRYEQWFLDHFQPELNFCKVAGLAGWKGSKHTEEDLVKMCKAQQAISEEKSKTMMGKKNALGTHHVVTDTHRQHLSAAMKGHKPCALAFQNSLKASLGNKFSAGKHHVSEEGRQKMVERNARRRGTHRKKKDTEIVV